MPANFNNADFDQAYTLSKAWVDAMQAFCADLDAVGTVLDPFGSAKLSENLRTAAKAARAAFPGMEYGQACLIVCAGPGTPAKASPEPTKLTSHEARMLGLTRQGHFK